MKKSILSLLTLALLLPLTSKANDDRPISPDKLPAAEGALLRIDD